MLAKFHRITRGVEYQTVVRRGNRFPGASTVAYIHVNRESNAVRFGFIVSKSVGNAVLRNRVRRRLKAVAYELLPQFALAVEGPGIDIVIRALPGSAQRGWTSLHQEVSRAADRFLCRQTTRTRDTRRSVTNEGNVSL